MSTEHLDFLHRIVTDVEALIRSKERTYNGSWKKRGGVGAYFVSARKYDSLEQLMSKVGYDLFADLGKSGDGTVEDTLLDIAGYALLALAERRRLRVMQGGTPEDGGHYGKDGEGVEVSEQTSRNYRSGDSGYTVGMPHPSSENLSR